MRSAFSAAANYRAGCKAQSPKAFTAKLSIAFEEIDESLFWLETINDLKLIKEEKLKIIIKEADELTRILASSRKTSQTKAK
jgi:four helix bundle protein